MFKYGRDRFFLLYLLLFLILQLLYFLFESQLWSLVDDNNDDNDAVITIGGTRACIVGLVMMTNVRAFKKQQRRNIVLCIMGLTTMVTTMKFEIMNE
mmetsp:Transcript_171/g.256  ORF Transcript_171/g.256 Transcript_171/m.256 type:complete len:97 (+) Transcript_171:1166-1456(+)